MRLIARLRRWLLGIVREIVEESASTDALALAATEAHLAGHHRALIASLSSLDALVERQGETIAQLVSASRYETMGLLSQYADILAQFDARMKHIHLLETLRSTPAGQAAEFAVKKSQQDTGLTAQSDLKRTEALEWANHWLVEHGEATAKESELRLLIEVFVNEAKGRFRRTP